MDLEPTYTLVEGPPAVDFVTYASQASNDLRSLLRSEPTEAEVQRFLESHPSIVPGACAPDGWTDASPWHDVLISQPTLPGLKARQPDFMWLTTNSDTWFPVLIEIERPSKKIFRRDGVPSSDFTQARNQLAQWRTWFGDPVNQSKFQCDYGIPAPWTRGRAMKLNMILIYGRREEFERDPQLNRQRASLMTGNDERLMSFDRLKPDPRLSDAITALAVGDGRYRAMQVPPTLRLGPLGVERLLVIEGLEKAIDSSKGWSHERSEFVKRRLPYWADWARSEDKGWTSDANRE